MLGEGGQRVLGTWGLMDNQGQLVAGSSSRLSTQLLKHLSGVPMPADLGLEAPPHTSEELGADLGRDGSRDTGTEWQRVLLFQQLPVLPSGQNLNCAGPTVHSLSWGLFMGQINCLAH